METNYIKKYFENAYSDLYEDINNPDLPDDERKKIKVKIELIDELKKNLNWQIKYPAQKQAFRIQYLATMRKNEASPDLIQKQELAIKLYDLITSTVPFTEAINIGDVTKPILDLCNSYRYKIDLAGSSYKGGIPATEEIENIFSPYFKTIALSKQEKFNVCYEKIEYLYKELKKISETKPL